MFVLPPHRPTPPRPSGIVTDDSACPVSGAHVRIRATPHRTRTDLRGVFDLPTAKPGDRITAWKPGYFIAGADFDPLVTRLQLEPLPTQDHADYEWVDPTPSPTSERNCGNCHGTIYTQWQQSAHARASTGRHFLDLYTGTDSKGHPNVSWGLLTQYELGANVCSSCHVPGLSDADFIQLDDLSELRDPVARQGVHCDFCHKINGLGSGEIGLSHGSYNFQLLRPAPTSEQQIIIGPLDDVDRGEDVYSPLYKDSRYCASCHEGIVFGVHVYSTYSEWQQSPAARRGQHCQDCHMSPTGSLTNIADGPPSSIPEDIRSRIHTEPGVRRDSKTLSNHSFFSVSHEHMLSRCLRVDLDFIPRTHGTEAKLRIHTVGVGHSVPTGYIDRQLILVLSAEDSAGKPLMQRAGPRLPESVGKPLHNEPGLLFARRLTDGQGRSPAPFWRAAAEIVDTRLHADQPRTESWTFADEVKRIRVQIYYRRFWKEVIDAKGWSDRDRLVFDRTFDR